MSLSKSVLFMSLGICVATLGLGCGSKPKENVSHHKDDGHDHSEAKDKHDHPEDGPHKGQLIELGAEEYHLEVTHDEASHTITFYLLDNKAKNAVSTADLDLVLNLKVNSKPAQYIVPAAPQESDPQGESSRYALSNEELHEALEAPTTTGRITLQVAGKSYSGEYKHHDHDEHK